MPSREVLDHQWRQTLATDPHWCSSCEEYRVPSAGELCPICESEQRHR